MSVQKLGVMLISVILLMAVAACNPALQGGSQVVEKVVTVETIVEVPAGAVAQVAGIPEVPRNRTLIMAGLGGEHPGAFTDVELFNPYIPGISRSGYYQAGTEGLFYYNMIGDTFHPWLAEDYEYNDDFTEATVKLREGAKWSDGTPFSANDVAFSLKTLKGNPTLTNGASVDLFVKDVEVVDDLTVKLLFNAPSPRFVWDYLTFRADLGIPMVPAHVWEGQDPTTFTNYDPEKGWPLVTGPYKLVATTVEQKIWDLREDWWAAEIGFQELPKVQRLIFLPGMNEITMAQMEIANEIDLAFSMTPTNMKLIQAQNPAVITHSDQPPFGFMDWWPIGLGFNTTIPPFDDPEIRWAMSYAIDRNELIQFAFSGFSSPANLPYPPYPGLLPYFDSISDLLAEYDPNEYNLAKSEEIMTAKGYAKDDEGFWAKDGQRVSFQIITFPQHPSTTPVAPVVSEQLRRAGFDASFLLPADFVNRVLTGEAVAFLWGHGGSMKDPYRTLDLYHIRHVVPTGERAFSNLYRWSNQEFSDIVGQMSQLPVGDPQITPLFHQAMEIWLPNLPDIPLVQTVIQLPMNTTYWTGWPNPENPYVHEGFWHRTSMLLWNKLEPVQ
jgi:peptide/nickel transport system substrate-binding protein